MQSRFANDSAYAPMLRTLTQYLGAPHGLGGLLLLAFGVGWIGPFGTHTDFTALHRHLYWGAIVILTVPLAHVFLVTLERQGQRIKLPPLVMTPLSAGIVALPVAALVILIGLPFGYRPGLGSALLLYGQCSGVLLTAAMAGLLSQPHADGTPEQGRPRILDHLPGARRGRLIRISAQDHYVEVLTDKGQTLVSMRFRDAIEQAHPVAGCQVHRSHWVAADAVLGQDRVAGRLRLALSDGSHVPVGRTFAASARAAKVLL